MDLFFHKRQLSVSAFFLDDSSHHQIHGDVAGKASKEVGDGFARNTPFTPRPAT